MVSNSCRALPAVVKQQQEEISRNHVPSLFAVSVELRKRTVPGLREFASSAKLWDRSQPKAHCFAEISSPGFGLTWFLLLKGNSRVQG